MHVHVATLAGGRNEPVAANRDGGRNGHRWMTGFTPNGSVLALQNEGRKRRRMNEARLVERFGSVTAGTVRSFSGPPELLRVHIGVAALTGGVHRPVLHDALHVRRVAVGAGGRGVLASQPEAAVAIVIELEINEGSELVAAGAALGGDLRGKLISVGIGMAVLAARALLPQIEESQAE